LLVLKAGGPRKSMGILRSAPVAIVCHSSIARVVAATSNDEPWLKEKIRGLGCQGFGFE